jgi:hypothetical protein
MGIEEGGCSDTTGMSFGSTGWVAWERKEAGGRRKGASPELQMGHGSGAKADQGIDTQKDAGLMWQNHLRNEESIFQDPDRVILDEARMHANTHTNHSKS